MNKKQKKSNSLAPKTLFNFIGLASNAGKTTGCGTTESLFTTHPTTTTTTR